MNIEGGQCAVADSHWQMLVDLLQPLIAIYTPRHTTTTDPTDANIGVPTCPQVIGQVTLQMLDLKFTQKRMGSVYIVMRIKRHRAIMSLGKGGLSCIHLSKKFQIGVRDPGL